MLLEQTLTGLLAGVCPRVFPDVAPPGTAAPYVTWQTVGGSPIVYQDNALPDMRNSWVQITCWAVSRLESTQLALAVESALVLAASGAFGARPRSALRAMFSETDDLRGTAQDFDIWAPRD